MSYLRGYTHDGGELSADKGLKAKELGLLERMDVLLAEGSLDPVSEFVKRVHADKYPLGAPSPFGEEGPAGCEAPTCASGHCG